MVASTVNVNRPIIGSTDEIPCDAVPSDLPKVKYTLVGIDIDTTGRRLIDEIVQLAAYTPKDHFEQYIMPYMNLNPAARQRHQVRVISIGFYRMLKSMQTYKIIKSKSEIAALKDFLDWLEALKSKDEDSQGIILVYHEERKFIPYMVLQSLKKYNLLDRFLGTVKSFANGLSLVKADTDESLQRYTLRKLAKVLSSKSNENDENADQKGGKGGSMSHDRDLFDGNASVRAKLAFDVALQLANQDHKEPLDSVGASDNMLAALLPYARPIDDELTELQTQNENLERQNSFRPVFLNYFKTTLYHRVRAVKFRIVLAEHGYDLSTLNGIWSESQRNGLMEALNVVDELKPEDKSELADLFDSFFDPQKTTIKPLVKNVRRRNNHRRGARNMRNLDGGNSAHIGSEQGAGGDKQVASDQLPDSTTKSPTPSAGGNNGKSDRNADQNNNSTNMNGYNNQRNHSRNNRNRNHMSNKNNGGGGNGGNGGNGGGNGNNVGGKQRGGRRFPRTRQPFKSHNVANTAAPIAVSN